MSSEAKIEETLESLVGIAEKANVSRPDVISWDVNSDNILEAVVADHAGSLSLTFGVIMPTDSSGDMSLRSVTAGRILDLDLLADQEIETHSSIRITSNSDIISWDKEAPFHCQIRDLDLERLIRISARIHESASTALEKEYFLS